MRELQMSRAMKQSDLITDSKVPDPAPLPRVPGWKILVRPVSVQAETKGGILLPETLQDDISRVMTVGKVLKVGEAAYTHSDFDGKAWCKVGDFVAYPKLGGRAYLYKGVVLVLLDEKAIDMVVENPKDLDVNFKLTNY